MTVGREGDAEIDGAFEISEDVFAKVEMACGWI